MLRLRIIFLCAGLGASVFALRAAEPAGAPVVATEPVVQVVRGITYATRGAGEMKLDLYLPAVAAGKRAPLLVWIHGGGWREGGRGFCPLSPLAKQGYAVASISYRFTQQALFPAQIDDARAAVQWLRAHAGDYGFDPARIGVAGESAGGLLAALLGTERVEGETVSSRVQAVVALCPPTDITLDDGELALVPELLQSADPKAVARARTIQSRGATLAAALGGPLAEHRELARRMSPVTHVSRDDPPFLLVHGDRDDLVPLAQSEILHTALKAAGVDVQLEIVAGAGHGFGRPKPPLMAKIKTFFDEHL